MNRQVHHAVFAYLFKHVVKETQSCGDVTLACTVQIHLDMDIRFFGLTTNFCDSFASKKYLADLVP